ncbi:MAG: hypothetical protein KGV51_02255 [Moraxellaceae bacterium]|nr:hypothetical protein [Moraxellaceae bacterium]
MKINNINIQNVLGIKSFNHDLPASILESINTCVKTTVLARQIQALF